jgi:hypothetical protein
MSVRFVDLFRLPFTCLHSMADFRRELSLRSSDWIDVPVQNQWISTLIPVSREPGQSYS